jgi:hypothetical protein
MQQVALLLAANQLPVPLEDLLQRGLPSELQMLRLQFSYEEHASSYLYTFQILLHLRCIGLCG